MTTALYRISSGEVIKIALRAQPFDLLLGAAFFGVLTDPSLPDGNLTRSRTNDTLGPIRELGFAKHADVGSNTIRNSTQAEIDSYASPQVEDDKQIDADRASFQIDTQPMWRKVFKAVLRRIIAENNTTNEKTNDLITQWEQFKADVAAASNLGDLKTSVASLSAIASDLPQRTLSQAVTALKGDIDKDD